MGTPKAHRQGKAGRKEAHGNDGIQISIYSSKQDFNKVRTPTSHCGIDEKWYIRIGGFEFFPGMLLCFVGVIR